MLSLASVTLRRGSATLLTNLSLTVHAGWRLGVIGRNGCGKSSLFALIAGELPADQGEITMPRAVRVATVRQDMPSTSQPAIDYVLDGDAELRAIQAQAASANRAGDALRIAAAHERLDAVAGYSAPARAAAMLDGLGFSAAVQSRPVASFSGGWRMRLNLARALMCRCDLLLLDEPTNHLDLDAVLWLQQTLASHPATLLVISHDRDFLDAVTDHILHLQDGTGRLYSGNYSSFETQRAQQLATQSATHAAQQRRIRELRAFVERFRAKASKARQAQARLKMIERIEQVAPVVCEAEFGFRFEPPARLPSPLIRLDGVAVGYAATPVLRDIRLMLSPGDRIGLLGRNGAGKSTLIRLLAGALDGQGGELLRDVHLQVGYFAQHQLDQLDVHASPLAHLLRQDPTLSEQAARNYLGGYLFRGDRVFEPVSAFSGGERARLALALLVHQQPNLLLLDEPTNHLDLDMRQALELALQDFDGAVVLVSHDRHLLRACCERFWRVADGRVEHFDGDLDDYARWLRSQAGTAMEDMPPVQAAGTAAGREGPRERRRAAAEQRAREKPLRDALARAERTLEATGQRLAQIEARLGESDLYAPAARAELEALLAEQSALRETRARAEQAWLEALEALESSTV